MKVECVFTCRVSDGTREEHALATVRHISSLSGLDDGRKPLYMSFCILADGVCSEPSLPYCLSSVFSESFKSQNSIRNMGPSSFEVWTTFYAAPMWNLDPTVVKGYPQKGFIMLNHHDINSVTILQHVIRVRMLHQTSPMPSIAILSTHSPDRVFMPSCRRLRLLPPKSIQLNDRGDRVYR